MKSQSFTTQIKKLLVTTTPSCRPYTVPDNRSFFEREDIQPNLPRRIANLTHQDRLHHLRSLRLVTITCARNVENYVDTFRAHIEPISDLFHPSSQLLIFENDSTRQDTRKTSKLVSSKSFNTTKISDRKFPARSERIAFSRNTLLNEAHKLTPDYIFVVDIDMFRI